MNCYKCGSPLGSGRHCLHCGAEVTIYRKIVRTSNAYYNTGLEKAKARDLSGAVDALKLCLQFNKNHIDARNLLGLVYLELGEVVDALCQWVISKNLKAEDNLADYYLEQIQGNTLEHLNKAVKNFNLALEYARHDSEDLAIVQLKSVISQNPKLMKAYELLALLYIKEEEYSKAGKILKRALTIDRGNLTCQRLAREIKGKITRKNKQATYQEQKLAQQAADEVIIPKYKERPKAVQMLLGMAAGVAICVVAYCFMLRPTIVQNTNNRWNQTAISYDEKLESKDEEITELTAQITELKTEVETMTAKMEVYNGENGTLVNYERILTAMNQYASEDWTGLAVTYSQIDPAVVDAQVFHECYSMLKEFVEGDGMVDRLYQGAVAMINEGQYAAAIPVLQSILESNPKYVAAIYNLGLCYEVGGDDEQAAVYFKEVVDKYPDSEYYALASRRVN